VSALVNGAPGRVCPLRYRYGPAAIAATPERRAEILYVIGGLYGNLPALDAVEAMARAEPGPVALCFNGDFNWFNVDDAGFRAVNERVLRHDAILGNVEAELDAPADDAGCGCAYPDDVDQATVERSNEIHARLKRTAARHPDLRARIAALPMVARYRVGGVRVGVVHGDAESLAGWRFDPSALDDPAQARWRADAFDAAAVDVFASTHTCRAGLRRFGQDGPGARAVANNGAAGMPNAPLAATGLLTRVSAAPSPHRAAAGCVLGGVHLDVLPIECDAAAWRAQFLANWPAASPAWQSYYARIAGEADLCRSRRASWRRNASASSGRPSAAPANTGTVPNASTACEASQTPVD
jgi:hypothetical protein